MLCCLEDDAGDGCRLHTALCIWRTEPQVYMPRLREAWSAMNQRVGGSIPVYKSKVDAEDTELLSYVSPIGVLKVIVNQVPHIGCHQDMNG